MLSDDEEEQLDRYIAAIRQVRSKGSDGRGSLPDLLRLIARSHNHARIRTNVVKAIEEDEVIGELFPAAILTEKAERQYRSNIAIKVEKLATMPIFGQYTPEAIDTILDTENKTVIRELQSHSGLCSSTFVRPTIKRQTIKTMPKSYPLYQTFASQNICVFVTSSQPSWPFCYSPLVPRDIFTVLLITLAGQNLTNPPFGL